MAPEAASGGKDGTKYPLYHLQNTLKRVFRATPCLKRPPMLYYGHSPLKRKPPACRLETKSRRYDPPGPTRFKEETACLQA
jgi:hypothetical protein